MNNGRSLIKIYHIASVLNKAEIGNTMSDLYRLVNINHGSLDYNFLRNIVTELEEKNYMRTEKTNGSRSRIVRYIDLEIKKKARNFLAACETFSNLFKD